MSDKPHIGITGTGGYLGTELVLAFEEYGFPAVRYSRQHRPSSKLEVNRPFTLGQSQALALNDIDCLIHCAWDFNLRKWQDIQRVNIEGSIDLFRQARRQHVPNLIFISSISAFKGCRSLYGQAKLQVEKAAIDQGAYVIRPGLIHGKRNGAMFAALEKAAQTHKWLPLVGGKQQMYLCHVDDLQRMLLTLIQRGGKAPAKALGAFSPEPLTFKTLLSTLASRQKRRPLFIPIPQSVVWLALKTIEGLNFKIRFRSDSLVSLLNTNPSPENLLDPSLGCSFRAFS